MNKYEFILKYWHYYLILEEDFLNTIRFVEICEENYNTYSVEYVKQYQSICSELDGLFKTVCSLSQGQQSNIKKYAEIILLIKYTDISSKKIVVEQNRKVILQPFEDWQITPEYKSPKWWVGYNNVKHNRIENFREANLFNIINSLAGLFLLNRYYIKDISDKNNEINVPDRRSKLFYIQNWESKYSITNIIDMENPANKLE